MIKFSNRSRLQKGSTMRKHVRTFLFGFLAPSLIFVFSNQCFASAEAARYQFEYRVTIEPTAETAQSKGPLRIWLPFPREDRHQSVDKKKVESRLKWKQTKDEKFGNQFLYFEESNLEKPISISVAYEITRRVSEGLSVSEAKKEKYNSPSLYLKEDVKIPLTKTIRKIAENQTKPSDTSGQKIRKLYDYVVKTMAYDKSGKGWGEGDAVWACDNKRGNCTDFHSLFMGLARAVQIPARFFIGFSIPADKPEGEIAGYHCWAEAYDAESGWRPVDASEAKKSGKPDDFFGRLPADRIEFTLGRDLVLEPAPAGKPLNYFIFPYAELGDKKLDSLKREFRFKKL
jgi:hypothetical protein